MFVVVLLAIELSGKKEELKNWKIRRDVFKQLSYLVDSFNVGQFGGERNVNSWHVA